MQLSSKTILGLTSLQLDIVLLVEVLKVFAFIACLSNVEDLPFQNSPKRDLGGLGDPDSVQRFQARFPAILGGKPQTLRFHDACDEAVPQRQLETTTSKFLVPLSSMFLVQNKKVQECRASSQERHAKNANDPSAKWQDHCSASRHRRLDAVQSVQYRKYWFPPQPTGPFLKLASSSEPSKTICKLHGKELQASEHSINSIDPVQKLYVPRLPLLFNFCFAPRSKASACSHARKSSMVRIPSLVDLQWSVCQSCLACIEASPQTLCYILTLHTLYGRLSRLAWCAKAWALAAISAARVAAFVTEGISQTQS